MRIRSLLAVIVASCLALPALGQQQATRVRGNIATIDATSMTVTARDGQQIKLCLTPETGVAAVKALDLQAIQPGSYIGTAAKPGADGGLEAIEVVVFPEAARGTGEGQFPWDLVPGSSMTNGTVNGVVKVAKGRTLDVMFKGQKASITVPPSAPVVTFGPAEPADLKPGLPVFVTARPAADGTMTAARIVVGRDGVAPPM
jgi:hypothetical protein